jgi:ectoine hydroxylase
MEKDIYPTRKYSEYKIIDRADDTCNGDSDWCKEYDRNGFYIFRNALDNSWIESALIEAMSIKDDPRYYKNAEPGSHTVRSALGVHESVIIGSFLQSATCGEIVDSITGCASYIHQSRVNYKAPKSSSGWSWHSDFETWHSQDGMPRMRAFTFMIPLVNNNKENGCLNVIPGSHKHFISTEHGKEYSSEENFSSQKVGVPTADAIDDIINITGSSVTPLECRSGDIVIFDCNTLHFSGENKSEDYRQNLFFVVNDKSNELNAPYNYSFLRPEEMAARKSITEI